MTNYFHEWDVVIDLEQGDVLPDGSWSREVTLVLVDGPGTPRRRPVAVTLLPEQARELGFCLLVGAEHAERTAAPTEEDER